MGNCSEYGKSPRNDIRAGALFAALLFVALVLFPRAASASGVVSPQVFTRGSIVYVVDQKQITYFSMDTRSAHTVYSSVDSLFDIAGVARSGDMIWASNGMGAVIAVNMQTGTVEDFSRGFVNGGGFIDVDRRFVWLAAGDTLYRMDLTSREWVKIAVPSKDVLTVRGLLSFNDQVHIITSGAVHILTIASDDWVTVPHRNFTLVAGDVRRVGDAVYFTQDRAIYRYDPSKRLFVGAKVRERIRAASLGPNNIDVVAGNRIYTYIPDNFSLRPEPAVPMLRNVSSINRADGRFICVTDMGLVTYGSLFNLSVAAYPDYMTVNGDAFVFHHNNHNILYTRGGFVIYNPERKLWSGVRIRNRGDAAPRKGKYVWDEDGARVTLSDKYAGTPSGTATFSELASVEYSDTSDLTLAPEGPYPNITLNLRTEDLDGRILDLTIDNAATTLPPQKGFYYKGVDGDILSRASFGVQGTGLARSNVSPEVVTEGVTAVFSGATAVDNGSRSVVTAAAGSGYLLSKTDWRTMAYVADASYVINEVKENREIVASSVKMYIDGVPLPATDYIYNPETRIVRLLRREKANPTSVVQISFAERAYPIRKVDFEPLPEDNFGQYNFVEGAVSPRDWMRARVGLLTVDREGNDLTPMALAGIPVEWRGAGGRSILFYPEIAYDNRLGAHSAGVTAGVREGKAFGSYSGRWVGRDFEGLDKPNYNNKDMDDEHEINIGYDLRDNFRANLYQVHRRTENNSLSNFELRTMYTGNTLPDIEMAASGFFSENDTSTEASRLNRKETFSLRLSDLSVRRVSEIKGIHNVGYDVSWTEYMNNASERGRVVHGMANFSPISSLTFTGAATYRLNPAGLSARSEVNPQISVDMRDLPRGVDMEAVYTMYVTDFVANTNTVSTDEHISGYFYPGEYVDALKRYALYVLCWRRTKTLLPIGAQPIRYALFPKDDLLVSEQTSQVVGLLFFPTDNLLLSTLNIREWDMNGGETYSTNERIGLWLQSGDKLEASAGVIKSPTILRLYTDALYEYRWANGLMTGAGFFGSHMTEKDSANAEIYAGPILTASVTKDLSGYIRSIENSHNLRLAVLRGQNLPVPDVWYTFYFRLKMLPDISIVAELNAGIHGQEAGKIEAAAYLHAGF